MKILLLGEYSNVHATLARGLRDRGHCVTVVSDGDGWKNYPRDIDITRRSAMQYAMLVARLLPRLRGYDVVQIINPVFLEFRGERLWPFYRYLRRFNGRVVLGAYGMDHYWTCAGDDCATFRYSDFNFGTSLRHYPEAEMWRSEWGADGPKGRLNRRIAEDCDAIVAGLYEYDAAYRPHFGHKLTFIPFPIEVKPMQHRLYDTARPLRFFIGIQRQRNAYKGTDIMLSALLRLKAEHPEGMEVLQAENVPFPEYCRMMDSADVLLDQLYSYTPAMNALQAMSQGLIVVGGGEPENYDILGEDSLRPIVNVLPNGESVHDEIERQLLDRPETVRQRQLDSVEYVRRHHDHLKVADSYLRLYDSLF